MDAYYELGLDVDANASDIKRAYRRMSLLHHPDKVQGSESRFNDIKNAYDVVGDVDRRKAYDSFGVDLGAEKAEMQIWSVGVTMLVLPLGNFTVKTAVACVASWWLSLPVVKPFTLLGGVGVVVLYRTRLRLGGVDLHSPESSVALLSIGIVEGLVVLHLAWPLLFDGVCVFYLVSEVSGVAPLAQSTRIFGASALGCLVLARLVRGRWMWVLGLEMLLMCTVLLSCAIAVGAMHVYIDHVHRQLGSKVKDQRQTMRKERGRLMDEVETLRQQLRRKRNG